MAAHPGSCHCRSQARIWEIIQTEISPEAKNNSEPPSEAWSHDGSWGPSAGLCVCVLVCAYTCRLHVHASVSALCAPPYTYTYDCILVEKPLPTIAMFTFLSFLRRHRQ